MANKKCKKCGVELNESAKFCNNCGAKIDNQIENFENEASKGSYNQNTDNYNKKNQKGKNNKFILGIILAIIAWFVASQVGNQLGNKFSQELTNSNETGELAYNFEQKYVEKLEYAVPSEYKYTSEYESDAYEWIKSDNEYVIFSVLTEKLDVSAGEYIELKKQNLDSEGLLFMASTKLEETETINGKVWNKKMYTAVDMSNNIEYNYYFYAIKYDETIYSFSFMTANDSKSEMNIDETYFNEIKGSLKFNQ